RRVLRDELGIDPAPRLREVRRRILRSDPELGVPAEARTAVTADARREPVPPARPAQLPAGSVRFVGREDGLAFLRGSVEAAAVVIHGMAGVGKPSLALRWAHETAPSFPDGQLYADLRGFCADERAADPAEVLEEFLRSLGVKP